MNVEIKGPYYLPNNTLEKVREITAGRKKLTLAILPWGKASCRLDNDTNKDRIEGETTAVFTLAKQILEIEARHLGKDICFEIDTSFDSMKDWLQTKGVELFNFQITPRAEDPYGLHAEAIITAK